MHYPLSKDEFHPYQSLYIGHVGDEEPLAFLRKQTKSEIQVLETITSEQWHSSYAPGKWTVAEVYLHVLDTERMMTSRALWIARGQKVELPGFDQDSFAEHADAHRYSRSDLLEEYRSLRESTIGFFSHLSAESLERSSVVSGAPMSVRALMYVVAGHTTHHHKVLLDRYL